jgi:hypothetical protein
MQVPICKSNNYLINQQHALYTENEFEFVVPEVQDIIIIIKVSEID